MNKNEFKLTPQKERQMIIDMLTITAYQKFPLSIQDANNISIRYVDKHHLTFDDPLLQHTTNVHPYVVKMLVESHTFTIEKLKKICS